MNQIPKATVVNKQKINYTVIIVTFAVLGTFLLVSAGFFIFLYSLTGSKVELSSKPDIGIVEVEGVILDSKMYIEGIKHFADQENVKAVIIRINSPGGSVAPCQEVYEEILRQKKKLKIYASMGSAAASGGYYIASATDRIFASPGTLTGSIGTIMDLFNLQELYDWAKIKKHTIKAGKYKDMGSPFKVMSKEEEKIFQDLADDIHDQFITDISVARNMEKEKVKALSDGRVFTGKQALENGLIDELGNLPSVIAYAARHSGISGKPKVKYYKEKHEQLIEFIMDSGTKMISNAINAAIEKKETIIVK
ncbi:MAG: signal peptide peptidase SppA [Pseudomonadota bacterium]